MQAAHDHAVGPRPERRRETCSRTWSDWCLDVISIDLCGDDHPVHACQRRSVMRPVPATDVHADVSIAPDLGLRSIAGRRASGFLQVSLSKVGLATGLLLSFVAASVLGKVLAGAPVPIDIHDPRAFGFAAAVLVATVLAAMSLPAWRATMSDPVDALRQD